MPTPLSESDWAGPLDAALAEDLGTGDVTTEAVIPPGRRAFARMVAREPLVVAGIEVAAAAGGFLGVGTVSGAERAAVSRIGETLANGRDAHE